MRTDVVSNVFFFALLFVAQEAMYAGGWAQMPRLPARGGLVGPRDDDDDDDDDVFLDVSVHRTFGRL